MSLLDIPGIGDVAPIIFSFLDPAGRKTLSSTCTLMRQAYLRTYFPTGLVPAPMQMSVDASWTRDGEGGIKRRCGAAGCTRTTSPKVNILGMKTQTKLGMLTHCGRPGCRDLIIESSYKRALKALILDGGTAKYVNKTSYYALMDRCFGANNHARMRTAHDMMINAMMKQILAKDDTECWDVDPSLSLKLSNVCSEKLEENKQIVYATMNNDIRMTSPTPNGWPTLTSAITLGPVFTASNPNPFCPPPKQIFTPNSISSAPQKATPMEIS
ncbi:MAG: hypothetical protein P4L69_11915 [Desulfosporosinus sp.]|nr:hypothetical protein [Desulfosporosinus sp.]